MQIHRFKDYSQNVVVLSLVAFLNDVAGETIRRLFPLFLSTILGVKTSVIGLVEGVGEAAPHFVEPLSGYLSDRIGKRKVFVVGGQILRSLMLLLVYVSTWQQALLVRFLDRTGKGIALSPRDALIADSTKPDGVGRAFGFNRAFDNFGASLGLIVILILIFFYGNPSFLTHSFFRLLIIVLALPSLLCALFLLIFAVSDSRAPEKEYRFKNHFSREFYLFLAINFLFFLGNFSDGFLILKAQTIHISLLQIFILLAILTLSSAFVSLPAGEYSDHHSRRRVLAFGWLLCGASFLGFANADQMWQLVILFAIYGIYYGVTQGVAKALVSDLVPRSKQAFAFGIYNVFSGIALFGASLGAGLLWDTVSPVVVFYIGAILSTIAAFLLIYVMPHLPKSLAT